MISQTASLVRSWGRQRWTLPLLAVTAGFHAAFIISSSQVINGERRFLLFDDAAISMRYAENLAKGHGLLWNPGEPAVEGITNPLWTVWMAVLHLIGLPRAVAGLGVMITSSLLLLSSVVLAAGVARRLAPGMQFAPPVAAALTAAAYPLAYWSLRGMEVGAVAAAALGSVALAFDWANAPDDRKPLLHAIGALAVAMIAIRLDAAVLVLPLGAWCMRMARPGHQRRRAVVVLGLWVLGGVAAMTAVRLAYYDDLLPNTYYLKATGVPLATRISRGAGTLGGVTLVSLVAPLAIAAGGVTWAVARRRAGLVALPGALVVAQVAYDVWVGGDAWEDLGYANRYLATVLPLLAVLGGVGVGSLVTPRRPPFRAVALTVAVVTGLGCLAQATWAGRNDLSVAITGNWNPWRGPLLATGVGLIVLGFVIGFGPWDPRRLPRSGTPTSRAIAVGLLTVAVILAANGNAALRWHRQGPGYFTTDAHWAREGLLIGACTRADVSVGVYAAGQIIYFSDRPGVDLLGKSDRVIARMRPPQGGDFRPGHNKYSYERSVRELRPAVISGTGLGFPADLLRLAERLGYERVGRLLVDRYARGIDRGGLVRGVSGRPARCRPGRF